MKEKFSNVISEQIYNYLIDMILDLQIKPGERIPEASIAQKFNVSRTPVSYTHLINCPHYTRSISSSWDI